MIPEALAEVLSKWSPNERHNPASSVPRVLYTIPNGVNPTGSSLTFERKQLIYKVLEVFLKLQH
jgi:DNA-binding transcriptional MocR family regulator